MANKDRSKNEGRLPIESIERAPAKRLSSGQKWLLIGSVVIAVVGLGLQAAAWITGPAEPVGANATTGATDPGLVSGFAAGGDKSATGATAGETEPEPTVLESWSPAIFRLGFSFFVGFCIAYALRAFLKIALIGAGVLLLALFGLQYAGVIDVDWAGMEQHYDTAMNWVKAQATSFHDFITGYLPSSASAAGGLFMGFRRR